MKQNISILGATGSIGDSTLQVIRLHLDSFNVVALSGFSQLTKLLALCQEFRPKRVCVPTQDVDKFAVMLNDVGLSIEIVSGQEGLIQLASDPQTDKVVAAIVGAAGLPSTVAAIKHGKTVLLANKESLVMAGELVMALARVHQATILPIDSEHNAIFQCLPSQVQADNRAIHHQQLGVKRLWLTASGGGFLHKSYQQMQQASVAEAVAHPNWSMGRKISIDSATMMNKGLELIEACHLFNLSEKDIEVVIHPQSIIHSMVEYVDGSFLAQLGTPDMKTPIAHALAYPRRMASGVRSLNVFDLVDLQFIKPDTQKFACLSLARHAVQLGNGATIALNAANEVAVLAFLSQKISLTQIAQVVERCLLQPTLAQEFGRRFDILDDIIMFDKMVRLFADVVIDEMGRQ